MTTKPERKLTLRDKLSRLTYLQAAKLLGNNGKHLIQGGGKFEIDIQQQVDAYAKLLGNQAGLTLVGGSAEERAELLEPYLPRQESSI